jgi:uncharacterized membrane protein
MKTCPNCGNQVQDDVTFCNNCGTSLTSDNANNGAAPVAGEAPAGQAQNFGQQPFQNNYQQPYGQNGYPQGAYPAYPQVDIHDHTAEFDPKDIADNKLFAVVPYLFGVLLGLLACIFVRDSAFVKFHLKNCIRFSIASVLVCLVFIIPFLGWVVGGLALLGIEILEIIQIVWVLQGKAKDIPVIGSIKFLK